MILIGCSTQNRIVPEKSQKIVDYFENSFLEQQLNLSEDKKRIDTLLILLAESELEICHYHPNYDSSRDYSKGHNKFLDELAFLHRKSLNNEKYIFRSVLRNHDFRTKQIDCYNCIMLFRKRDCDESDNYHRLNKLPNILKDTSNVLKTIEILKHISVILDEPCERTQQHIRTEVKWRIELFKTLESQIQHVRKYNNDEEGDLEYIYDAMAQLPDSLTTEFAYNYLMQDSITKKYNSLPWAIFDILEHSIMYEKEYTYVDGSQINLTNEKINTLKERLENLNKNKDCDWCVDTLKMLENILEINKRNAYH